MTMEYLASLPIQGIKLQLLHILKGTDLGQMYEQGLIQPMELDSYIDILVSSLELLPPDIVIHRLTGDGPGQMLLAPLWSRNKKLVLNRLNKYMKEKDTWQGKMRSL